MATVQKRTWLSRGPTGHKVRKVAYGYTLQVHGKQEWCFRAEWTREDAQAELAKRLLERESVVSTIGTIRASASPLRSPKPSTYRAAVAGAADRARAGGPSGLWPK